MKKIILLSTTILLLCSTGFSDTIAGKKENVKSEIQNNKPEKATLISESEAYQLLYENSKETNNRTLNIIQWVIGITIAFLLAILGSQIFFNYRLNRKEVDFIKKDLDEKLTKFKSKFQDDLNTNNKITKSEIKEKFEKITKENKESIESEFEKKSKFIEIENKYFTSDINRQIKQLTADIEKNSGDIWGLKGVESNALSSFIRVGLLKIELKNEAKYILDDIIEILEKLNEIHSSDYNQLDELTSKMPGKYKTQKDKIIANYKDKPVYKYVDSFMPSYPLAGLMNRSLYGLGSNIPIKQYVKNNPVKEEK